MQPYGRAERKWPGMRFLAGAMAAAVLATTGGALASFAYALTINPAGLLRGDRLTWIAFYLLLFVLSLGFLKRIAEQALSARALMYSGRDMRPRRVLIMGLSDMTTSALAEIERDTQDTKAFGGEWALIGQPTDKFEAKMDAREAAGEPLPHGGKKNPAGFRPLNRWQQNVRAIAFHGAGEIATITGHGLRNVHDILDAYLARTHTLAESAITRLDDARALANRGQK